MLYDQGEKEGKDRRGEGREGKEGEKNLNCGPPMCNMRPVSPASRHNLSSEGIETDLHCKKYLNCFC
jgi:hypothetical protein